MRQKTWTVLPTDVQLLISQSSNAGVAGAALAAQNKFKKDQNVVEESTIRTQESDKKIEPSKPWHSADWVAPLVVTSSAIALAISLKQDFSQPTTATSNGYLNWAKNFCLIGQIGLGIAAMFIHQ
jgi:hypothetical protein